MRIRLSTAVAVVAGALLAPAPGATWAATPTVSIASPTAGATVKGTVQVAVSASVGGGDHLTTLSLYDGVDFVASRSCQSQPTCGGTIAWPATGLSGQHSLTVRANTAAGGTATSAAVAVNVVSPPPAVAVTSPAGGSTVVGSTAVTATAATDPSQDDYPTSITVYDGVDSIGTIPCQSQQTCGGSVTWDATLLSGVHALTARVRTSRGLSVTSPPAEVLVANPPPAVEITTPRRGAPLRRRIKVRVAAATDPRQVDYPTSIAVYDGDDAIGTVSCQKQQTCGGSLTWDARLLKGRHRLTALVRTNRGRSARSAPVVVGSAGRRKVKPSCSLRATSVAVGRRVRGTCRLRGVPVGTRAAVQYRDGRRWRTVLRGKVVERGRFEFTLRGSKRATFDLWIRVSASRRTKAARGPIGRLRIR